MEMTFDFKDGEMVAYDMGVFSGTGKVIGVATIGAAVIGKTYIIEDCSGNLPTEQYPYNVFACFEVHLQKI